MSDEPITLAEFRAWLRGRMAFWKSQNNSWWTCQMLKIEAELDRVRETSELGIARSLVLAQQRVRDLEKELEATRKELEGLSNSISEDPMPLDYSDMEKAAQPTEPEPEPHVCSEWLMRWSPYCADPSCRKPRP